MPRLAYVRGVSEVFGLRPEHASAEDRRSWGAHICRFTGQLCDKKSQHKDYDQSVPFGACSVWHRGDADAAPQPYVICPTRFLERNRVLLDMQRLFRPNANAIIGKANELSFDEIGRIDDVIAQLDAQTGEVLDFAILEIMACSTTSTGDVLKSFHATLQGDEIHDRLVYGINYRQVLSRMVIQALSKIRACELWHKHMVWAIQDTLYNYMHATTLLDLQVYPIDALDNPEAYDLPALLLFIYRMQESADGRFELKMHEIRGGKTEEFARVMDPRTVPTRDRMVAAIKRKKDEGKFEVLTGADVAELADALADQ